MSDLYCMPLYIDTFSKHVHKSSLSIFHRGTYRYTCQMIIEHVSIVVTSLAARINAIEHKV